MDRAHQGTSGSMFRSEGMRQERRQHKILMQEDVVEPLSGAETGDAAQASAQWSEKARGAVKEECQ